MMSAGGARDAAGGGPQRRVVCDTLADRTGQRGVIWILRAGQWGRCWLAPGAQPELALLAKPANNAAGQDGFKWIDGNAENATRSVGSGHRDGVVRCGSGARDEGSGELWTGHVLKDETDRRGVETDRDAQYP